MSKMAHFSVQSRLDLQASPKRPLRKRPVNWLVDAHLPSKHPSPVGHVLLGNWAQAFKLSAGPPLKARMAAGRAERKTKESMMEKRGESRKGVGDEGGDVLAASYIRERQQPRIRDGAMACE
jgi:hypothetical protein